MLSICFLLGEVNDFTVAGVAVKLQSVTLKFGSINNVDTLCSISFSLSSQCWPRPWTIPLKKPLQDNIGREKDGYYIRAVRPKLNVLDCNP